jgi:hypothetical protein
MFVDTSGLGRIELKDWEGKPVSVASAWAERPAVLVWLRHFG